MRLLVVTAALAAAASANPEPAPQSANDKHIPGFPPKFPIGWPDWFPKPPPKKLPLVNSKTLQKHITKTGLLKHAKKLQSFAERGGGNRAFGGLGHNLTTKYIVDWFKQWPDYYTVETQPFVHEFTYGKTYLTLEGELIPSEYFTYGIAGTAEEKFVEAANLGCELSDFPPEVAGNIALISRGTCEFGLKVALAGAAGAAGAVLYNNAPGVISGTLGASSRPEGPYVPMAGITQEDGLAIKARIAAGEEVIGRLNVDAVRENRTSSNVFATTKRGNQHNVVQLGAHSDSVPEGPGINDDGSGVIAQLEVGRALAGYDVKNAVRFSFWTAEEFGLVGSEYYIANLPQAEQDKIRLYLNYDMIASPNYALLIYDGDGSSFNLTGPAGSDKIEANFEKFYKSKGKPFAATEFSGRSDYGPFLDVGIPAGGLFTGAEGVKTEEMARLFGGEAGVAYDINYHKKGDDINNLNWEAFVLNSKAVADSVAYYGVSTADIPKREKSSTVLPRQEKKKEKVHVHSIHGHSGCGKKNEI